MIKVCPGIPLFRLENFRCPVEYPVQVGDGHSVVADGDAGFDGGLEAVPELFARDHATAALDDHGVVGDGAGDGVQSRDEIELKVFARVIL